MNYLFERIQKELIDCVGFDLDGTLYDEFDFIFQVYNEILKRQGIKKKIILEFMLEKWLVKGSSYNKLFCDVKNEFSLSSNFEKNALDIFRNYCPNLKINKRVRFLLEFLHSNNIPMFIVTDGKRLLQNNKIDALGIREYFNKIIITESNPKPDILCYEEIRSDFGVEKIIYLGDREIDQYFSKNNNFQFIKCNNGLII